MRTCTASAAFDHAANCRGLTPKLPATSTCAPASSSSAAMCGMLSAAAACSAVTPCLSAASTSAPYASSASKHSGRASPASVARCNGRTRTSPAATLTSTPARSSARTRLASCSITARCRDESFPEPLAKLLQLTRERAPPRWLRRLGVEHRLHDAPIVAQKVAELDQPLRANTVGGLTATQPNQRPLTASS
eukprot:2092273-Pleurochrysis_carterae.AAC.3